MYLILSLILPIIKSYSNVETITPVFPPLDLFKDLMPVAIHQALAAYDVRKTDLMNMEVNKLRESTQLLNRLVKGKMSR